MIIIREYTELDYIHTDCVLLSYALSIRKVTEGPIDKDEVARSMEATNEQRKL